MAPAQILTTKPLFVKGVPLSVNSTQLPPISSSSSNIPCKINANRNVSMSRSSISSTVSNMTTGLDGSEKPKRKRQRLDHLTQEEKIMRRKLKNRMAAQSARDRKKVKMLDLEGEVDKLHRENQSLLKQNRLLQERLQRVEKDNIQLRKQLGIEVKESPSISMEFPESLIENENSCSILASTSSLSDVDSSEDNLLNFNVIDENEIIFDVNMGGCGDDGSSVTDSDSCTPLDGTFESAALISVPLPKEQVPVKQEVSSVPEKKPSHLSTKPQMQKTVTSSLQQLTSFLMLLLAAISMNGNSPFSCANNSNLCLNLSQNRMMGSLLKATLNPIQDSDLQMLPPNYSSCLPSLENQLQINSVLQLFQKRVRLRI